MDTFHAVNNIIKVQTLENKQYVFRFTINNKASLFKVKTNVDIETKIIHCAKRQGIFLYS